MNFKKLILPAIVVAALIAFGVWKLSSNKKQMEESVALASQKMVVFPVTVINPQVQTLSQNFEETGTFNPVHELMLLSEVAGRITSVKVKEGDYVSQGQVLLQVDNEQTNIDLQLAESSLEKSKSDLAKLENMLAGNAASKQQVEDAKLGVKNNENRVASLKRQLRLSSVVAPISGYINGFKLEVGSFLSPGALIAEIVDISRLKMTVKVLDNQIVEIKNGQSVSISPDLYQGERIAGKVISIASKADAARRFEVEIEFPNSAKNPLKAGMTGKALFEFGGTKQAVTIPANCLVGSLQQPQVYVVENEVAYLRDIVTGAKHNGFLEIISGVDTTETVVQTGQLTLADKAKVLIIK